jgi:hypothetical protein
MKFHSDDADLSVAANWGPFYKADYLRKMLYVRATMTVSSCKGCEKNAENIFKTSDPD